MIFSEKLFKKCEKWFARHEFFVLLSANSSILHTEQKGESKFELVTSDIEFVAIEFNNADSEKINEKAEDWFVCGEKLIIYCAFAHAESEF